MQDTTAENDDVLISDAPNPPFQNRHPTCLEAPITPRVAHTDGHHQAGLSAVQPIQVTGNRHDNLIANGAHASLPVHSSQGKPGLDNTPVYIEAHRSSLALDPTDLGTLDNTPEQAPRSSTLELLAAFGLIFIPMSLVAFALIGFVYYTKDRVRFDRGTNGTLELPASLIPPYDAYYTTLTVGRFLLLASWASTAAGVVVTPFMLLFSFVVARELTRLYRRKLPVRSHESHLLKEILSGSWCGLLHWAKHILCWVGHVTSRILGRESQAPKMFAERRATNIAALGLCITGFLS